jgi:hypothetical protein
VAPDHLVDERQLEVARQLCRDSIAYMERQLGTAALRPPGGQALIRRLMALRGRLQQLEEVLEALSTSPYSGNRTP